MRLLVLFALVSVSACAGRYRTDPGDHLQARLDVALTTRAQLSYYFLQLGAVERPPRPDAIAEAPGPAPFAGATWTDGAWQWRDGRWQWRAGAWGEPDSFSPAESDEIADNADVDVPYGLPEDDITNPPYEEGRSRRPPRAHPNRSSWRSASAPDANVRDHRSSAGSSSSWASSSHPDAPVRDHRSDSSSKDDDKKDTKDYGGVRFGRGR